MRIKLDAAELLRLKDAQLAAHVAQSRRCGGRAATFTRSVRRVRAANQAGGMN